MRVRGRVGEEGERVAEKSGSGWLRTVDGRVGVGRVDDVD